MKLLPLVFLFGLFGVLAFPFKNDGVVNPPTYYQRWRQEEYKKVEPKSPFFQWFYFTIKDLESDDFFAITYAVSVPFKNKENLGSYFMASHVSPSGNAQKVLKLPIENFHISDYMHVKVLDLDGELVGELNPIDNDTFHITGKISTENVWMTTGSWDKSTVIEWDLTLHRVYGWYGQADLEYFEEHVNDLISWDTYCHYAKVEGTIKIGEKSYAFSEANPKQMAYGDENWGTDFPHGASSSKPIDFPWGWYSVVLPPTVEYPDPLSIIAGVGKMDLGFPEFITIGRFADIRLSSTEHVGLRLVDGLGVVPVVRSSSDGKLVKFDVDRRQWQNITDSFGTAQIPLLQIVHLETEKLLVQMAFESKESDYVRLLFPYDGSIFSDFEGLGVKVNVTIVYKETGKKREFQATSGGVEYGYDAPVNFPQ